MGKKAPTIGYWYKLAIHFGLCKGPVDAVLEIRGGDRKAWDGAQTESGTITINAPNLWGGEKAEGGIVSDMDVMMGEAAQAPNAYLTTVFGGVQSAFRGLLTAVFKGGLYGAFNPYPKPMAFKVRRIFSGWDQDVCWYPAKAAIGTDGPAAMISVSDTAEGWGFLQVAAADTADYSAGGNGFPTGQAPFASAAGHLYAAGAGYSTAKNTNWSVSTNLWLERSFDAPGASEVSLEVFIDNYVTVWVNGTLVLPRIGTVSGASSAAFVHTVIVPSEILTATGNSLVLKCEDLGAISYASAKLTVVSETGLLMMNPAHILYDTITSIDGQAEPIGMVNDASFRAAADTLFDEGFGLCMVYDGEETIEAFQQRVCDIIGGCLTQSRVNGEYYLDLIRDDYVLEDLLIVGEADVLEFSQEPAVLTEAVNQVLVDWFDPQTRQDRTTSPAQSLGLIASNGVISQTRSYRPVPYEDLANRLAARDVRATSTPLSRFNLITTRKPYALRPGQAFRLQLPSEGIPDMVCRLGSIDHGTLTDGRIRIVALQDVFTLPSTVTVVDVPGDATAPGSTPPAAALTERVLEAPYLEVAGVLAAAELAALTEASSFLLALGVRPNDATTNFSLYTAADGEAYADRGAAEWCPSALVVESATRDPAVVAFTLSGGVDLDAVEVGTAALWGNELVRVDALDVDAGTVELARGCGDTVPAIHSAGERIWFYDGAAGADGREYADGELVHAKLLTRTGSDELPIADAAELSVTMAGRAALPYAPGQFKVNGHAVPTSETGAIAVTWVHRSRILQADQLLESAAAGVGPEPGTQYVVTLKNNVGTVLHTSDPISGTSYTFTFTYSGTATLEIKAIRGALESWQKHACTFTYAGGSTSIPPVTPGPTVDLEALDGTELVTIEQDGIAKECTVQAIAQLAHRFAPFAAASGADTITATFAAAPVLVDGLELRVRAAGANTSTAPTFNPNGAGALTVYKTGGQALAAGDIFGAGHEFTLRYRASPARYELLNPAVASGGGGGGGSAGPLAVTVAQTAHGFVVGNAVYNGASAWGKAASTASATAADGIVSAVASANAFTAIRNGRVTLTTAEWDAITGDTGGLVRGTIYYASATAGMLTKVYPGTGAQPILKADSTTEAWVMVDLRITPDIKRFWRIYMTAPNSGGDLYAIQELEFRMTAGGTDTSASSSPCFASSTLGGSFQAAKVVDGDILNGSNAWASATTGTQWITVDLGASFDLQEIAIMPYVPGPASRSPLNFLIQWSPDNAFWTTAKTVLGSTGWTPGVYRTFSIP